MTNVLLLATLESFRCVIVFKARGPELSDLRHRRNRQDEAGTGHEQTFTFLR